MIILFESEIAKLKTGLLLRIIIPYWNGWEKEKSRESEQQNRIRLQSGFLTFMWKT